MSEAALRALGWSLADASLYVLLLALATAAVQQALSPRRARLRYGVAYTALMLTLPLTAIAVARSLASFPQAADPFLATSAVVAPVQAEEVTWKGRWLGTYYRAQPSARSWAERVVALADPLMPWAACGWLAGVSALALWQLGGSQRVLRLLSRSHPSPVSLRACLAELCSRLGGTARVRIVASSDAAVPMVVGLWRPTIVVPDRLLPAVDPRALESLVAHELAHVHRRDPLANGAQAVVESLLFFHPGAWWLSRLVRQEREHCCDDIAVSLVRDELLYARSLLSLQEVRSLWPQRAMAATGSTFALRIDRLCRRPERRRAPSLRRAAAALVAGGTAAALSAVLSAQGDPLPLSAASAAPVAAATLDVGLVAHYPFDGDAREVSGRGHAGLVQGATLTTDRFGRAKAAYDFDGRRARIVAPAARALDTADSISVSCWVLPRAYGDWKSWVAKAGLGGNSQWRVGLGVAADEWGFTEYTRVRKSEAWLNYWLTKSPVPLGAWSHIVAVFDAPKRELTLYRDAARLATFSSIAPAAGSPGKLFIGYQADDNLYFDGKIDELRIYARTLRAAEVRALYRQRS